MNKEKLTMNVLFSGIGCQERGFENSNLFDVEVVNTSEINKEAVLSYAVIHCGLTQEMVDTYTEYPSREEMVRQLKEINLGYEPEKNKYYDWDKLARRKTNDIEKYWLACKLSGNLGDISKITEMPYADLWTCSFPCTDVSVAGKMKGLSPDTSTRSSLLWENIRLLKRAKDDGTLPKYLMFENVKNLVSKKFIDDFNNLLEVLDELSFNSYWRVLNAKDCGIPQNRERVFVISIRKDIDNGTYDFPKPFDTGIRLKDVLDKEVDEKYYLSNETISRFITTENSRKAILYDGCQCKREGKSREYNDFAPSLTARDYKDPRMINTNVVNQVGNYRPDSNNFSNPQTGRIYSSDYISPTLNTMQGGDRQPKVTDFADNNFRVRKLTPNECWKLMGLTEEDCANAKNIGVADSQLYKQAGNGIVTNCVEQLAEHLYKAQYDNTYKCTDENFI